VGIRSGLALSADLRGLARFRSFGKGRNDLKDSISKNLEPIHLWKSHYLMGENPSIVLKREE
jgi:hypothetical protein